MEIRKDFLWKDTSKMHSLKKVLQMDDITWKLYVVGEHEGLFDDMSEVEDLTDE